MKIERYHSNDLKRLILKNKMSSMVEMKEVMGTNVDATIFRKLRELHYLRSYSGYQLKPGHFVNSTGYLGMIFYPFLPVVIHPFGLLSIQTGLGSLSQIIVRLLLFHRVSLDQSYE